MSASPTAAHRHFHDELSELKAKLLTMSGEAQDALGRALDALLRRDGELAAQVIAGDHSVDALELEIEETVIDLLATQQPMARDLRLLRSLFEEESCDRLHQGRVRPAGHAACDRDPGRTQAGDGAARVALRPRQP